MNPTRHLPSLLCLLALGPALLAQTPSKPPPWWGVQDDVTVSLYWDFSGPAPLTPLEVAVPPWYSSTVTRAVASGPLTILPSLNGHTDVLALVGAGAPRSARLDVKVDNDPHIDWVKIFWFQFDEFEGASGSVVEAIEQDLARYKRASLTTSKESLGNGWNRVTVNAQLIPQPDDEDLDFAFTEAALGTAAIDNLFVNSKCVKVEDTDADGEALGTVDGFPIDLAAATGTSDCLSAAVTEGAAPAFQRTYWISARATLPGAAHQVFQLNQAGVAINVTPLPETLATAPGGASDLAVATIQSAGGTAQTFVYAMLDRRTTPGGGLVLRAMTTTGALAAANDVVIANFPGGSLGGLAYNPSGNVGNGTFLITDLNGFGYEYARTGTLLRTVAGLPASTVGAGYDAVFGRYYFFSSAVQPVPTYGTLQTTGSEWSANDFQPTGVRFFGDLQILNPGGVRGGIASGLEVHRRGNGGFRAVCVVRLPGQNRSMLYELKGPFRFGASLAGTVGMQGLPVVGSPNFTVTLDGRPEASFASLYAGFAPQTTPFSLAPFGFPESAVLINLDMNSVLLTPTTPGSFAFTLPPLPLGFASVPLYFQWLVFDASAPGGFAMSPGGKTLLY